MPYEMRKVKGGYRVTSPHGVKAKHTTRENAERQMNLLRGVEHGWHPTGRPARRHHAPSRLEQAVHTLRKRRH